LFLKVTIGAVRCADFANFPARSVLRAGNFGKSDYFDWHP
jgi:hypothetical protein